MAGFKLNRFMGIRPRVPDALLQANEATLAQHCDLAYGEIRPTKAGYLVATMSTAVRSIYSDDGLRFYTWNSEVSAVRSPLARDQFNRLYFTGNAAFRVTDRAGQRTSGGEPASSYLVGVPRPSAPPALVASTVQMPTFTNAFISLIGHYEYAGVKYQELSIYPDEIPANSGRFRLYAPALDTTTPAGAKFVIRMTVTWRNGATGWYVVGPPAPNEMVFDLYSKNSSFYQDSCADYTMDMESDADSGFALRYWATIKTRTAESDKETRAYTYTCVNIYGEEGPPAPPGSVSCYPAYATSVTVTKPAAGQYAPLKEIRIYRTPPAGATGDYYYVGSVNVLGSAAASFTFNDTVASALLNEPLASHARYAPDQMLTGLVSLPNGILCAFKGNEIHFSDAYMPWSWPPEYVQTTERNVVGIIAHGAGALVTTLGAPYLLSGVSPDSMTLSRINGDQAGVAARAMAVVNGVAVYASNDGLVTVNGMQTSLALSHKYFTRDVWRQRYLAGLGTMTFAVWDGRLLVFSSAGLFTPFMLRLDEMDGAMSELPGWVAQCAYPEVLSDQCFYSNGTGLYQFNGGNALTAVWQSAELVLPVPGNFGAALAVADGNWTVEWWAYLRNKTTGQYEYQLKHTQAVVSGSQTFRLPGGFESDRYKLKISGTGRFRELRVARTMRELAGV